MKSDALHLASTFVFSHGPVRVQRARFPLGLAKAWFGVPTPRHGRFIVFEDDIELSPSWYRWLSEAWNVYESRDDLAGITLQRQTLVPALPQAQREIINKHEPFLYALVGSIGFSPNPSVWTDFLRWLEMIDLPTFDVSTPALVTSKWWNTLDKRHMWTQHFIYYTAMRGLYTLYINLPNKKTLAAHMRAQGAHYHKSFGADFQILESHQDRYAFPRDLIKYSWDGSVENLGSRNDGACQKVIRSTMLNAAKNIQLTYGSVEVVTMLTLPAEQLVKWILIQQQKHAGFASQAIFIASNFHCARKILAFKPNLFVFAIVLTPEEVTSVGDIILRNILEPEGIRAHLVDPSISPTT